MGDTMGLDALARGIRTAATHVGTFAADLGRGVRDEGRTFVTDVGTATQIVRRSVSGDDAVRAAQRATNRATFQHVRSHPVEVAKGSLALLVDPIRSEWKAGRPGAAIGRGTILALGPLLPGVGTEKLVRVVEAAQAARPGTIQHVAASGAAQAIDAADDLVRQLP